MDQTRKLIPLLATAASLLMAVALVIGAAAAPDPFKGKWHSTDVDGSYQTLHIGGGPGSSYHVRYFDDGASVCAEDMLTAASANGWLTASGDTLSGVIQVYCLFSPPTPYESGSDFEYRLVGGNLLDQHGITWTH